MKTLNITISKNFGKNISLELPNGSKHIITQSHNPSLYHGLIDHLNEKEIKPPFSSTLLLPDDYVEPEYKQTVNFPKGFDGFDDDKNIPLENIND